MTKTQKQIQRNKAKSLATLTQKELDGLVRQDKLMIREIPSLEHELYETITDLFGCGGLWAREPEWIKLRSRSYAPYGFTTPHTIKGINRKSGVIIYCDQLPIKLYGRDKKTLDRAEKQVRGAYWTF